MTMVCHRTTNFTKMPPKRYVFLPIDFRTKTAFYVITFLLCSYGIIANAFLLYCIRKQRYNTRKKSKRRPLNRDAVNIVVESLAWSELLSSLTGVPLVYVNNFIDLMSSDWYCRIGSFVRIVFSSATLNNLFIIGVERYFSIFYPLIVPSRTTVKKLVLLAWMFISLINVVRAYSLNLKKLHIDHEKYTLICAYDTDSALRWVLTGITAVCYCIPIAVLFILYTRILNFHRKKRRQIRCNFSRRNQPIHSIYFLRYKISSTFAHMFFVFIFPYMFFIAMTVLRVVLDKPLTWFASMYCQQVSSLLAYTSSFISPTVMLCRIPGLTSSLKRKQRTRDIHNGHRPSVITTEELPRITRREKECPIKTIEMDSHHHQRTVEITIETETE